MTSPAPMIIAASAATIAANSIRGGPWNFGSKVFVVVLVVCVLVLIYTLFDVWRRS